MTNRNPAKRGAAHLNDEGQQTGHPDASPVFIESETMRGPIFRYLVGASPTFGAFCRVAPRGRGTVYDVALGNLRNEHDNLCLNWQSLWQPTDNPGVPFAGDFSNQKPEYCAQIPVVTGTTQRALNLWGAALAAAQDYASLSPSHFDRLKDVDVQLNAGSPLAGVSLRANVPVTGRTMSCSISAP